MSVSMSGGEIQERLEWLRPEPLPEGEWTDADKSTIKAMKAMGFKIGTRKN